MRDVGLRVERGRGLFEVDRDREARRGWRDGGMRAGVADAIAGRWGRRRTLAGPAVVVRGLPGGGAPSFAAVPRAEAHRADREADRDPREHRPATAGQSNQRTVPHGPKIPQVKRSRTHA